MASEDIPTTMRAWQFSAIKGGVEKNLKLETAVPVPKAKGNQHLIRVLAVSLNPVDYKVAEVGLAHRFAVPKPATPGSDFAGRIVRPATGSDLKAGDVVFGTSGPAFAGGALSEYVAVSAKSVVRVPEGVDPADAASIPVAGLTAYQSLIPYVKEGSRVFINGGSGGTGSFAIQIAKQAHAHVTASCSATNIELCKSLGADDVLDYTKSSILEQLQAKEKNGLPFDLVVDNVGKNEEFFWKLSTYSSPQARYIFVGATPSLGTGAFIAKAKLLGVPGFLGGSKRTLVPLVAQVPQLEQLEQIAKWIAGGQIKSVVGSRYKFEEAVEAITQLKTGRTKGKIIVEVA